MNVYIAGSSTDLETPRELAILLERKGYRITRKWWLAIDEARARDWQGDENVEPEYALRCAREDLEAVAECQVLVFLEGRAKSFGAPLEIGAALALETPILAIGTPKGRIWERLPLWNQVESVREAMEWLEEFVEFNKWCARRSAPFERFESALGRIERDIFASLDEFPSLLAWFSSPDMRDRVLVDQRSGALLGRVKDPYWTVQLPRPCSGQITRPIDQECERVEHRIREALGESTPKSDVCTKCEGSGIVVGWGEYTSETCPECQGLRT